MGKALKPASITPVLYGDVIDINKKIHNLLDSLVPSQAVIKAEYDKNSEWVSGYKQLASDVDTLIEQLEYARNVLNNR